MKDALKLLIAFLIVWAWLAEMVFGLRHPWASETECFLHILDAMKFKKIAYSEMRPRE